MELGREGHRKGLPCPDGQDSSSGIQTSSREAHSTDTRGRFVIPSQTVERGVQCYCGVVQVLLLPEHN